MRRDFLLSAASKWLLHWSKHIMMQEKICLGLVWDNNMFVSHSYKKTNPLLSVITLQKHKRYKRLLSLRPLCIAGNQNHQTERVWERYQTFDYSVHETRFLSSSCYRPLHQPEGLTLHRISTRKTDDPQRRVDTQKLENLCRLIPDTGVVGGGNTMFYSILVIEFLHRDYSLGAHTSSATTRVHTHTYTYLKIGRWFWPV